LGLINKNSEFGEMTLKNKRPWGYFEVLSDAPNHKVKRIVIEPGGILSLQRHKLRSEHWFVVSGKGIASIDGKDYSVQNGSTVDIPSKKTHRLENSSAENLVIIEVQTGEYFGEDDIERLEDKYGRV
jgi:mannose-6-phosphate isomerase